MSEKSKSTTQTIAKILIIIGVTLTALLFLAILVFVLGAFIFAVLGEGRYFAGYVVLNGYYAFINLLFLLDYMMMMLGSFGIPLLVAGFICKVVGKK